ncbi:MAG: polyhydroxyalkanoate depolymerase [Pseudomonadota bacterium]
MFSLPPYNPIYDAKELQHDSLFLMREFAKILEGQHGNYFNPLMHSELGRNFSASIVLFERLTRDYPAREFGIDSTKIDNKKIAVEEITLIDKTFCKLKHFKKARKFADQPKILLVAPMAGHYATLLRGTVEGLLPFADVYITEWKNARDIPPIEGSFNLDDFISYVIEFMHHLSPNLHVIGVCQPVVPVLSAVSIMETNNDKKCPDSITLIGGPIDVRRGPTEVTEFAEDRSIKWFERNLISRVPYRFQGFSRQVYPGFLQLLGFLSMNLSRHIGEHQKLFDNLVKGDGESAEQHTKFYDEYLAVMDLPAEFYLQTIDTVFHKCLLPRNKMKYKGQRVLPANITNTALLALEGERDDIAAIGQTKAAIKICKGLTDDKKEYHLVKNVGHYGLFNGRRFRENIVPKIVDFAIKHKK